MPAARQCGGGCDGAVDAMLQCQKVSDFLIAASYLSIPLELLYFASCADLAPIKWLLLQLAAFAVLGGAIHMLAVLTHHHPHSSRLLLASTVAKILAALVSFATALSLLTFIPLLIRVKLREALLRTKAHRLDHEVGLIRRRVEATSRVVRMLSHHICSSPLDPHAILHTTMLHLGDALSLHSCAVWMPGHTDNVLQMVHQLSLRDRGTVVLGSQVHISADDPDVVNVQASEVARVLRQGSALATASGGGGLQPPGAVAAIRMPMLKVSNFDGRRTPEASSYAILVLVLPSHDRSSYKRWSSHDLEIVPVVADQVAVALSHAAVLEEWQSTRDTLAEQHRALLQAKHEATVQAGAINSSQSAMCGAMRRQMHSIVGLLSLLRQEAEDMRRPEQRLAVDAICRTSALSLTLMNDADGDTETLTKNRAPFGLHSLIREAMVVTRCLAGITFSYQSEPSLPEWVVGDETRVFHLLLHMVGTLLLPRRCGGAACLSLSVTRVNAGEGDGDWIPARSSLSPGCSICVKFHVGMEQTPPWRRRRRTQFPQRPSSSDMNGLIFSMRNKIVQMMNGGMWSSSSDGESITVVVQFQLQQSGVYRNRALPPPSIPRFSGLRILLADSDDMSRLVTRRLLEKLGCQVMSAPSGAHCLGLLRGAGECFQLVLLDLDASAAASASMEEEEEDVFEVALRIRELGNSNRWLLVVAALAVAVVHDGVRDMCQRVGINCVVQKPITLTALGDQLAGVLWNN